MLIFLYGADTYRSLQKLKELRSHYQTLHKESIHSRVIDCQDAVFSLLETELKTRSLFQTKKLVVLKNLFQNKELLDKLREWQKFFLETQDIIVFFEGELKTKDPFFGFLKEHAKTQEFLPLFTSSLKTWIAKEFLAYKVKPGEGVVDKLVRLHKNDLFALANEIKKLAAFAKTNNSSLSLEHANLLLKEPLETDIFLTIDTIKRGNKRKALELLLSHLEKGESPFYILSMLSWYARTQGTLSIHEKVWETDLAMKTGAMEPNLALFSLVASL
ncbi:MAG: hypothetical protein A3A27_02940 [Candidatus Wildermuthbacteria bacterium RIFCSPLOWO2_01_FULL_47_18]|uniref:DNA polymerase III delta N-terminal domain-containing protein n=2 Tax=Candidatus Wildermuthiibacteriota TaxID=1817923 RepID=A0A1G2RHF9_9BACT|nr:MAG: hypothetical protein A3J68_00675 [Candidatus Wildermuthbacteria bacterium RIFCSPHIGHO2_02_FULL_48_16]OHA71968.1 MAG: hypothetical protein A3A27_02940 [Candidatus Wildermuthbacteria bacterium RIFCSPLOWO2_01_FULL_47_18]